MTVNLKLKEVVEAIFGHFFKYFDSVSSVPLIETLVSGELINIL